MQSTQRILNYVDEFAFRAAVTPSITGSGYGSVEVNKKTIEVRATYYVDG